MTETENNSTFTPIGTEVFTLSTKVADANKVTLANASNKSDVYPITYANCVKVSDVLTLDELLKNEHEGYINNIVTKLNTEITKIIENFQKKIDSLNVLLKELKDTLPNYVNGANANGISITSGTGGDGKDISLLINDSIFGYTNDNKLTLKVADPFEITSEGLKLKLSPDGGMLDTANLIITDKGELDCKVRIL